MHKRAINSPVRNSELILVVRRKKKKEMKTQNNISNALFVSTLMFSRKWFIFQRAFSRKLSYFPMFGNDLENALKNVL